MSETNSGARAADRTTQIATVIGRAKNTILELLRGSPALRVTGLFLFFLLTVIGAIALWYIWFRTIHDMWVWTFEAWWQIPLGLIGIYLVGVLALALPAAPGFGFLWVVGMFAEAEQKQIRKSLDEASLPLEKIETELEKKDKSGLISLVRYSREQLKAYYEIGLNQTHRSFRYSVVAMWIGFFIIVTGIVITIFPVAGVPGTNSQAPEIKTLILAGGGIIELISALFLWVYRSSLGQLTYFYNRQIHSHNVLMCSQIASTMQESDPAKQIIIEKVLERTWMVERPGEPGSGVIARMFST